MIRRVPRTGVRSIKRGARGACAPPAPPGGLVSFNRADPAGKRLRLVFGGGVTLMVLLLGFFAYSLAHAQRQQRKDLEKRFHDRADVSAAVTDAIFNSAASQTAVQNAGRFGGSKIDPAALAKTAQQSQAPYVEVVDSKGRVLGATPGAPRPSPASAPYVTKALRTSRIQLSDVLPGPRGATLIASASPFASPQG